MKADAMAVAARLSAWVVSSIGSIKATVRTLNMSCTMAAPNARRNSSLADTCPMDTSMLVTLVPILAPMTIGTAVATGISPVATSPTVKEVVKDELWTSGVIRMPTNRPASGLAARVKRL